MSDEITPFRIAIRDDQLEDLKRRLRATRWPERECVDDWTQGLPLAYAQEIASYWLQKYDWRARETLFTAFRGSRPKSTVWGSTLIHVRSPHVDATPLVITHGWPSAAQSFARTTVRRDRNRPPLTHAISH